MRNIIYILALLMVSCGSVKKDKSSIETESNKELNAGNNMARWINSNNWGLEPVDLSQPMTFTNSKGESETYTNTKVFHNNTHTTEIIHDTIAAKEEFKQDVDTKNKETDNNQIWLYFMMALVVVMLFKK
jgi:uncharacterized protein YceK